MTTSFASSSAGSGRQKILPSLLPLVVGAVFILGADARASGFEATIPIAGSQAVNLRDLANAAGYNGAADANVAFEVGTGVTIMGDGGSPSGGIAIDSGTWPSGYAISITLVVRSGGSVLGGGGAGGSGNGQPGGAGGDAVYCRTPMSITVDSGGSIRAGGGGGGSGGRGYYGYVQQIFYGAGGGGGGFPNGPGGGGGGGDQESGHGGAAGTESGGGPGGSGASPGATGGAGGVSTAGSAGGDSWEDGGAGGAAGYAIRRNGHPVGVTNNGTIVGVQG